MKNVNRKERKKMNLKSIRGPYMGVHRCEEINEFQSIHEAGNVS